MTIRTDSDLRQFVRFAVVGGTQSATNLALFALALALGVPLVLAAVTAAIPAFALSFTLNRLWTFPGAEGQTTRRAFRFVFVWLAFVAVALPTLVLLVDVVHLPRVAAQGLIIAVGAPLSYLLQRRWTFASAPAQGPTPSLAPSTGPDATRIRPGNHSLGA